jgi:hypothetical protein
MTGSNPLKRRTVLKMSGGTAAFPAIGGVVSGNDQVTLSGPTYDTLTHKTGRDAHADLRQDSSNRIEGQLRIAGYELQLNSLESVDSESPGKLYTKVFDSPEYQKDGTPLKLKLRVHQDQVSGILSRTAGKYGKLGFSLFDDYRRAQAYRESFKPDSRWVESSHSFEVPKRGVPTDSGIDRLMDIISTRSEGVNTHGN